MNPATGTSKNEMVLLIIWASGISKKNKKNTLYAKKQNKKKQHHLCSPIHEEMTLISQINWLF